MVTAYSLPSVQADLVDVAMTAQRHAQHYWRDKPLEPEIVEPWSGYKLQAVLCARCKMRLYLQSDLCPRCVT